MGILKILIFITILFLPIGELGRYIFPSIGRVPILANDLLVILTVSFWLVLTIKKYKKDSGKLVFPTLLFIFACSMSLFVNSFILTVPQIFIASLYIFRWVMYAGLYFVIQSFDVKFKEKIIYVLLAVGQIIVGIGYLQYFLYPSLRNLYYLGWDEHLYRMFSVFLDPNFAGIFFTLVFLLTVGVFAQHIKERNSFQKILLLIMALFDVIAIYLTYSRSALVMLLLSVIVFFWMFGKKKFILFFFAVLIFAVFLSPKSFQTEGTNIFRIASSEARFEAAQKALIIFQKNPFLGVGFNAYRYAQNRFGFLNDTLWIETHAGAGTDNSFLFILATTGIIGFVVYMYLLFVIFQTTYQKIKDKKQQWISVVIFASFSGVCVSAFFINSLFYIFIMEWLWILLGVMDTTESR